MEITNSFTMPVRIDELWALLVDVERVAPCIPGFTLQEAADPEYRGVMKVKVGAITAQYNVTVTFRERDEAQRRAVIGVQGKERGGPGSVDATATAVLLGREAETAVEMRTDIQITGRIAQFGRGIIADVSSRITDQFVTALSRQLGEAQPGTSDEVDACKGRVVSGQGLPSGHSRGGSGTQEMGALDLGAAAVIPLAKRAVPLLLAVAAGVVALRALLIAARRAR